MSYCDVYILKNLSGMLVVTICQFKYLFLSSVCVLILTAPVINVTTFDRLTQLFISYLKFISLNFLSGILLEWNEINM